MLFHLHTEKKVKLKDIKFKDLPKAEKDLIYSKLPNSWSREGYGAKINNRIRVQEGWRGNYECASDSKNCHYSASITVSADGLSDPVFFIKNNHICCGGKVVVCEELIDAKHEMTEMVKALALDNAATRATEIAAQVMKHFEVIYAGKAFSCVDRNFMERLVYRTRQLSNPDWTALIFSEPFRWCRPDDKRSFTRFCNIVMIDDAVEHFVGFAHPDILFEVGDTKLHSFLDCTFSIVPVFFSQLLVFMLYFSKYDLYVPFYFVLMTVRIFILFITNNYGIFTNYGIY